MNWEAPRFDRADQALDRIAQIERALQRDILSARSGMLRNYDPLVREIDGLRAALDELKKDASGNEKEKEAISRLAASIAQQEDMTEEFKSKNALLRNSLAYFGLFSVRLSQVDRDTASLPGVGALSAAMLQLTLDTSPPNERAVEVQLQGLAGQLSIAADADSMRALIAHGNLLRELLPATDTLLRGLFALPVRTEESAIRAIIFAGRQAVRQEARIFRLLLYAVSLLLLCLLVALGLRLRAWALSLHWRARLEHVIANISTSFISTNPENTGARVEHALGQLAECIGAHRAYFAASSVGRRNLYRWGEPGVDFPSGWPDRALELVAQLNSDAEDIIHVPAVNRMRPGADKAVLAAAGIRSWICVLGRTSRGVCGILGFDIIRPSTVVPSRELGLLRTAFDAAVNALSRDHLERERAQLEARLQQSRRLETVGALTSGLAHNFNNIVGAILGYTEIAESHIPPSSRAAHSLSEIRDAGARARDLIEQILAFGRRREGLQTGLRVKALLAEAKSLLEASLPSGIELVIHDAPETLIRGEAGELQQVILNLCHNAAQAMDQAGRIEIGTEVREIRRGVFLVAGKLAPSRYAVISVRDTGRGMTKATMARIFEPFFTTRPTGNGLGLSTACEIVREHNGAINVDSAFGEGSCFEVWLPCQAGDPLIVENPASVPLLLGRGETVLIIDDEHERLLRGEEMLAALGYEPVGFASATDAITACRAGPDRFDALLVAHLPSVPSALSAAAALRDIAPDRPVLLAAASASEIDAAALVRAGVSQLTRWPLIASELAAALKQSLGAQARPAAVTVETRIRSGEI
jgi:signal transduction histidine kinase/CheY-like chemotaxis protein